MATRTPIYRPGDVKNENTVGTREHYEKWYAKVLAMGFSHVETDRLMQTAMAERYEFGSFKAALLAHAGVADGIRTAPAPSPRGIGRGWDR